MSRRVERLSRGALQRILSGKFKDEQKPLFFVIKFYSNGCHYCHELHDDYVNMANKHDDASFFAFNIDDDPSIQNILDFKGVPTICTVYVDTRKPRIRFIPEPSTPHKKKWYYARDIDSFINKEKMRNER